MKFTEYLNELNEPHSDRLNEAVSLKAGDYATYKDRYGATIGLLVIGSLNNGCIATTGGMIGVYTPKNVDKFTAINLDTCVYIDDNGKVEGKYPISKFNGSWDAFLARLADEYNNM